jgi:hypothetical protein
MMSSTLRFDQFTLGYPTGLLIGHWQGNEAAKHSY